MRNERAIFCDCNPTLNFHFPVKGRCWSCQPNFAVVSTVIGCVLVSLSTRRRRCAFSEFCVNFPEFAEPELVYSWLNSLVQKVGEAGLVTLRITILEPDLSPMFDEASSLHIKTRRLEKIRLSLISSKAKGSYIKCEEYRAWPCQTSLT